MTFSPDDMVIQAVKAMSEKNYGASVIVDGGNKPIGIHPKMIMGIKCIIPPQFNI